MGERPAARSLPSNPSPADARRASGRARGSSADRGPDHLRLRVRFFGAFRELAGTGERELTLPDGSTVADLVEALRGRDLEGLPERPGVAVNLEYASGDRRLADGDEVALVPPLAGG